MWGVIFSFLEGRRVTDLLASLMGLSIAISSGTAKSIGLFVMENLHISEFWMPAFIGAFAFPLLSLLGWLMTRLPQPTEEDKKLRIERVTLNREGRMHIFKSFMPVLLLLFFANLFITVLQDIKEDFLVKIINFVGFCQNRCDSDTCYSLCFWYNVIGKERYESIVCTACISYLRYIDT